MYNYRAFVERVVDADTFDLTVELGFDVSMTMRVRLYGLDAPETWRPETAAEKAHGEEATAFVKDLMEGKYIEVDTFKDKKEKYGRYLATVTLENGFDLSDLLRDNGFEKRESYE